MKRAITLTAATLGLAAVVGGGVWGVGRIAEADRTAPTRYWSAPDAAPAVKEAPTVPPTALAGLLLPMPVGYVPGPDLREEGNDFTVPGPVAIARMKEDADGLSASERKDLDRTLDTLRLTGMAGRSYRSTSGGVLVEIRVTRAAGDGLKPFASYIKEVLALVGETGAKSPKVPGYPEARCAQAGRNRRDGTRVGKDGIETLTCSASLPGTLVTFRASGPKPFDTKDAVGLLVKQLDHVKSPGERV
ncbi:hypothetical protein [Streptomyces sp. NPDC093225]|uniref:hypothetical protein n=1 Tax=Streptomyces sp. NPDC093225 TaxID=3366034 RepID=UPI003827C35A